MRDGYEDAREVVFSYEKSDHFHAHWSDNKRSFKVVF